jgi:hypothetical protein
MNHSFLAAALLLLGPLAPARAGEPPAAAPTAAATSVRLQAALSVLQYSGFGVQVSRRLVSHIGVDVAASFIDLGRDHPAPLLEVMVRGFLFPGRHGLSVAAGLSGLVAREYGPLAFFQAELAYEVRVPGAVSVLAGVGPQVALNQSGTATCAPGTQWCRLLWKDRYMSGDTGVQIRLGLGYSF